MVEVFSKALIKTISIDRILWDYHSTDKGPTTVFFAGLHGNETAGVFAVNSIFKHINKKDIKGSIIAISGNLNALKKGVRFIDEDLNRLWTKENITKLENRTHLNSEEKELLQLLTLLEGVIEKNNPPYYFIDLHTTSSQTLPFITINDSLINRGFSKQFPVPIILGIEEYLNGPLLSYINTLGYVSIGFESGQHDHKDAIKNAEAFITLALIYSETLEDNEEYKSKHCYNLLKSQAKEIHSFFEIIYLHRVNSHSEFKMKPNYTSFQKIEKGEALAFEGRKDLFSEYNARIFMPLYQKEGSEGFFVIKRIAPFFIKLSELLRNLKIDALLTILPGVSWVNANKQALKINLKTARFLAKPLFHLLGYRNEQVGNTSLITYNRERASKTNSYKHTRWHKKTPLIKGV